MGLTTTASGACAFRAFWATVKAPETMQPNIFTTHVIPDEDDESFQPKDLIEPSNSDTGNGRRLRKTRRFRDPRAATDHNDRSGSNHACDPRGRGTDFTGPSRRITTLVLSPGTFVFQMHTTTGTFGTTAQAPAYLQETLLHGVSIREADKTSMEGQGR